MAPTRPSPKSKAMSKRQLALRRELWPDSDDEVWVRLESKGFTSIPRILPLILLLITILDKPKKSGKGNPSKVYFDLWCRIFDEAFLEVSDEEEFAYSSGYIGSPSRAVRTWREHIKLLTELGFIRTAPKGNREIGYVLIVDPYRAAEKLKAARRVPDAWWNAFLSRVNQTGATLPSKRKQVAPVNARVDSPGIKTKPKKKSI